MPVSHGHQHQISCSEVWTQESMQLRTVCDKRLYVPVTSGSFEAKISIDIQQTFFLFCNNVSIIEDKIFATDFLRFFQSHFKKRKKSCFFWNLKKNEKYVFSNTAIICFYWCYNSILRYTVVNFGERMDNIDNGVKARPIPFQNHLSVLMKLRFTS